MSSGGNWKDLLKASGEGNVRLVQYHLRNGVDPNFQHAEYFTCPIFEAIRNGHQDIVKILIEQGKADPGIIEELTDQTTIEVALESGHFGLVDYLNSVLPENRRHRFRNVLVIGGHHGRSKAICKALLKKGHHVAFICPSQQDGDVAIKDLKAITSNHKVEYILANEVESIRSAINLAHVIQQKFSSLDVLIFNNLAELLPAKKQVNEDGLESVFFWKYMAPFVLMEHLGSLLEKNGPDSRVVFIADDKAFLQGHPDVLKTPFGKDYHQRSTHWHTESCRGILFRNVSQRFEKTKVRVMAAVPPNVHPSTEEETSCCNRLMRILPNTLLLNDTNHIMVSGAVWLAESPEAERYHGKCYDGVQPKALPASVDDLKVISDWEQWTTDFLVCSTLRALLDSRHEKTNWTK